uniref:Uncharacterized protein n=1 Tax=Astatotilapia calliptera TaxID=8154 RepID=A0A3P8NL34_ASTCA
NFHLYQLEGVRSLILGLPRCQKNMTEDNSLSFHIKRSITDIYVTPSSSSGTGRSLHPSRKT